ncbi:14427_t:CDS:2 [Cetraspora pellucida]|uniref:14427_t:CDS:1 n=1 Tax=Cetraspora pellucida TaxID=1433469 RepID=A0ACA9P189_9GLOM|nr:14427_t:CDS:2 [Cetraspora pellucida]
MPTKTELQKAYKIVSEDLFNSLLKMKEGEKQFTGQKVPALTGTVAEIQTALQQLQLTNAQILNNQNQI